MFFSSGQVPVEEYFATKISCPAVLVSDPHESKFTVVLSGPLPKSAVPTKVPATITLLFVSTATPFPASSYVPPKPLAQRQVPAEEYLAKKASEYEEPLLISVPHVPPKFTVPLKLPVTYKLPLESKATAVLESYSEPPIVFDHGLLVGTGVGVGVGAATVVALATLELPEVPPVLYARTR